MTERLHIETYGDSTKPAMLLIHGFLSSNSQWLLNKDALSEHFYLVMAELWGHGNSPAPSDNEAYSAKRYIEEIEQIRNTLSIEKWFLIGQSFGAGVVINYALQYPEHVSGLVFTNSRSALGSISSDSTQTLLKKQPLDLSSLPMHPKNARNFSPQIKQQLVRIANSVDIHAAQQLLVNGHAISCRERFDQIKAPCLLTNGIHEKGFQADVEFGRQALPSLEIVNLDAGHSTNLDAPDDFNKAVVDFCLRQRG